MTRHAPWTRPLGGLLALTLLVFVGCAPRTDLNPAPAANQVGGMQDAAVSEVDGVNVLVQADEWPGDVSVRNYVLPVRVVIENNSDAPVRLRYNEFALVGTDGTRYSAIPPFGVDGAIQEPELVDGYTPIGSPAFTYSGFEVAPYHAPMYPGMTAYGSPFTYDPVYYDRYYTYWERIELPTTRMLSLALPEGVIQPGGSVSGYLYFEKLDDDVERVRFRADLVAAGEGAMFGEVSIPFTVQDA